MFKPARASAIPDQPPSSSTNSNLQEGEFTVVDSSDDISGISVVNKNDILSNKLGNRPENGNDGNRTAVNGAGEYCVRTANAKPELPAFYQIDLLDSYTIHAVRLILPTDGQGEFDTSQKTVIHFVHHT